MEIQAKNENKDVYAVKRLFSKHDMVEFVNDGGLIRYKRLVSELEHAKKEFYVDIRASTFLSIFVIFSFITLFLVHFVSVVDPSVSDVIRGVVVFILPCIASVLGLLKYTDYKQQIVNKKFIKMEELKEKYPVARKFTYEELENYSIVSKKVKGLKGNITFYRVSDCLLTENSKGRDVLAILNVDKDTWHILEYHMENTYLEMYKIYEVNDETKILLDWQ